MTTTVTTAATTRGRFPLLAWLLVATFAVASCGGSSQGAAPASTAPTTTTPPSTVPTTAVLSPFEPQETAALLDALDKSGARSMTSDAKWLSLIKDACGFLDGQTDPKVFSDYLNQFIDGVNTTGKGGVSAATGLVAGTKIACPAVGFPLDVALARR